MDHRPTQRLHNPSARRHALLAAVAVTFTVVWLLGPTPSAIGAMVATVGALHAAAAVGLHVVAGLAGVGVLIAALRSHTRGRSTAGGELGATLHAPRIYDWLAAVYCLGREHRMRERTLDVAGVAPGAAVLDVCCGTGTLALAARPRVGEGGAVYGIDASAAMIARAKAKASRNGLPVRFEIAAAQALPFGDATFDVVLCTLALHHLPDDGRAKAIEEMQRVLKPGGRVLIVEFGTTSGASALLHPVEWLHRRKSSILDGVVETLHDAEFARVSTGPLGFAGLGYALAHRD